jgi:hypothetical protein
MTSKQEIRLSMYMAVHDFLTNHSATTKSLPEFDSLFSGFSDTLSEIRRIREQQELDITGIGETKHQLKDRIVKQGADIARKVVAYAIVKNNTELMNEVNYSETDLARSADNILPERIRIIMGRCVPIMDQLKPYGIEQPALDDLEKNLQAFLENLPRPRLGITERKQSTTRLSELFDSADGLLNKIDCLVGILQISNTEFYNLYRSNRHIVDTTTRMLSLIGTAIERTSREPVKGASFTFHSGIENSENIELTKITSEKGSFHVKSIPCGEYTVRVSKPGYKEQEVQLSVADGERTDLVVEMEK